MDSNNEGRKWSATPLDWQKYNSPFEINRTKITENIIPAGRQDIALDLGSGLGHYTKILAMKGWKSVCVDTDPDNIKRAAAYAFEAHLGDAISALHRLPAEHYGLVCALEIIEHMSKSNGQEMLKEIHRVLKPRGHLILSTPNRYSPEALVKHYIGEKLFGWRKWMAWEPTHVYIYNSWEILKTLKERGFEIEQVTGHCYEPRSALIEKFKIPYFKSNIYPFNRLGFDIIIKSYKK